MKKIILLLSLFLSANCFAQTENKPKNASQVKVDTIVVVEEDELFVKVEVEAEFIGGAKAWKNFIIKNLNPQVPSDKGAKKGKYVVIVRFTVDRTGKLSDIVVESNPGFGCGEEAVRVMKISPLWKAATQNGYIVRSYKRQPFTFIVE